MASYLLIYTGMDSVNKNGHVSVILAAATMAIVIVVFTVLVASTAFAGGDSGLSRTLPLLRLDGTTVGTSPGAALPKGTVKLAIKDGKQSFTIDAYNLAGPYDKGLVVFLGDAPQITNAVLQYVDVLSQVGTNNHWHLAFESAPAAPAQLGVTNLTDLVGSTVFVASETNNAILRAVVIDLVPDPAKLSYRRRVPLMLPDVPLSLKARGSIFVKYDGRTGASIIDIRARGLNANNRYIENGVSSNCVATGVLAVNGAARWGSNTGLGDELVSVDPDHGIYGSDVGITTALDEIGQGVVISDCFDGTHLWGIVPGPKN